MSSFNVNELSKHIVEMYNIELKEILTSISYDYSINKDELFNKYTKMDIKLDSLPKKNKKKNKKNVYLNLCIARKQDGNQCTRRNKGLSDYCGKHIKNNKYGRIDDNSNIVDKLANDDNYVMTWKESFDGKEYLVDSNNIVYTTNINSPIIIGKKISNGNLELIN